TVAAGTTTLTGTNTFASLTNAAIVNANGGATNGAIANNAGGQFNVNGTVTSANTFTNAGGATLVVGAAGNYTVTAGITNNAGGLIAVNAGGTLTDALVNGGTVNNAGTYNADVNNTGTIVNQSGSIWTGTVVNGPGGILSNFGTINGAVTINGGTFVGNGAVVGNTRITGGTFAPGSGTSGTSMTVTGNLAFAPAANYLVAISPTAASFANVSGTATLAGTVQPVFALGSFKPGQFVILESAGLGGTTFAGINAVSTPANFGTALSYTPTDVLLTLTANLGDFGRPNSAITAPNQVGVATAINTFFNNGGTLPPAFLNLFGLTGARLQGALAQISGEGTTAAQQGAAQLTSDFMLLMFDAALSGGADAGFAATPFAAEPQALPPDVAAAYASALGTPRASSAFEQRWNAWGTAYGGASGVRGDAALGTHDVAARAGGFAAGADYRVTPDTRFGFALAGAYTGWGLADGLGGGHGDAFQAGLYGRTATGPAYLAGALSVAEHWMSTDRFALGDHLTADFAAQSYGARLEAGYRLPLSGFGIIPYAAAQAQLFRTPAYSEIDRTGGGLGLAFNAHTSTDARAELGSRFEAVMAFNADAQLALRARLAWAHDWVSNAALLATFQSLPGASFIVNGAAPPHDSGLVTFGPEILWRNGWSLLTKFDGDLASGAHTYAGTARLRYAW
ncbi:MAG TPA: autotransporter domain-containing protein, partial [Xanthobacteraceae bacterium]